MLFAPRLALSHLDQLIGSLDLTEPTSSKAAWSDTTSLMSTDLGAGRRLMGQLRWAAIAAALVVLVVFHGATWEIDDCQIGLLTYWTLWLVSDAVVGFLHPTTRREERVSSLLEYYRANTV